MVCQACGAKGADVRPHWTEQPVHIRGRTREAFMPYVDDIKRGNVTSAVAWTILLVAFAAAAAVIVTLAAVR